MSYRVAFVSFKGSQQVYPTNCHRGDIVPGDLVYITMPKKRVHKKATVHAVEYLNWRCKNSVYCLVSELLYGDGGKHIVERQNSDIRFHTANDLMSFLVQSGWKRSDKSTPRAPLFFWSENNKQTARLRFHGLGIDVQIFNDHVWMEHGHDGREKPTLNNHKIARHRYYHSERCIFEFIAEFSVIFSTNKKDYSLYLTQIGKDGPKQSSVSDFPIGKSKKNNRNYDDGLTLTELYDIMSDGSDAPAYLGDGIYIGSDGSLYD